MSSLAQWQAGRPIRQLCSFAAVLVGTWRQIAPLAILWWFCAKIEGFFCGGTNQIICYQDRPLALAAVLLSSSNMLRYLTLATASSLPSYSSAFASPAGMYPCPLTSDPYSYGQPIHDGLACGCSLRTYCCSQKLCTEYSFRLQHQYEPAVLAPCSSAAFVDQHASYKEGIPLLGQNLSPPPVSWF